MRLVSRDEDYCTGFQLERMGKATKNTNQNFRKFGTSLILRKKKQKLYAA
jgi:hypothetical protein